MRNATIIVLITALAGTTVAGAQGRNADATAARLTAQDYLDIQQLSARYAFLIDACTNGGNDFADLFQPGTLP